MSSSNELRRAALQTFGHLSALVFSRVLLVAISASSESLPPIIANQNHVPAGTLHNGVLTIHLEIAKGVWHPEAEGSYIAAQKDTRWFPKELRRLASNEKLMTASLAALRKLNAIDCSQL